MLFISCNGYFTSCQSLIFCLIAHTGQAAALSRALAKVQLPALKLSANSHAQFPPCVLGCVRTFDVLEAFPGGRNCFHTICTLYPLCSSHLGLSLCTRCGHLVLYRAEECPFYCLQHGPDTWHWLTRASQNNQMNKCYFGIALWNCLAMPVVRRISSYHVPQKCFQCDYAKRFLPCISAVICAIKYRIPLPSILLSSFSLYSACVPGQFWSHTHIQDLSDADWEIIVRGFEEESK